VPASDVIGERASPTQPFSALPSLGPLTLQDDCRQSFPGLRYKGIFTPSSLAGTLESPGKIGGINWGSAAFDPETGIYYAANNHSPFKVRLIKRNAITMWLDRHVPMLQFSSLPLLVIGGAVSGVGYLTRRSRRASVLAWIVGAAMVFIAVEQSTRRGMMATLYNRELGFSAAAPKHIMAFSISTIHRCCRPHTPSIYRR
jgi:quinoprotein glucose dehydrogenase